MSWDVAVAGGGLAGAAAATHLALAGQKVVLFEREPDPHDKVCGEFLSGEAIGELTALDLSPAALGAVPIGRVTVSSGRLTASAPLPFLAWGFSRRRLDERLLNQAAERGVDVRRGQVVRSIAADGDGVRLDISDEPTLAAAALLATGKHDLRGWRRSCASELIGLKLHLQLNAAQARALEGHVELNLFNGGYAGLQPVEGGIANLCLLVSKARFASLDHDWRQLVATIPHLASRLDGARAIQTRPLAIAGMPYGYLASAGEAPVYRVGDQAAVIPSFTGDGMAMALRSARAAADAILTGRTAARYHTDLANAFRAPMWLAHLVAAVAATPMAQDFLVAASRAAPWLLGRIAAGTRLG